MEIPVIVEWVKSFDGGFGLISANLNPHSERYSDELEKMVEPFINKKYNTFTITANIVDAEVNMQGGQYIFIGEFVKHPKFGDQFKAEFYYQDVPATVEGLQAFLITLPNIKAKRSEAIIAKFGVQGTFDVLNNNVYRLTEINGITTQRIPAIQKVWEEKKCKRELYSFFLSRGLSVKLADAAYKQWDNQAKSIIETNPYRLVELRGVGFIMADKVAHKIMDIIPDDFRTTACMQYILNEAVNKNSNLCLPYVELKKSVLITIQQCDEELGKTTDIKVYLSLIPKCLKSNMKLFAAVKDLENENVSVYLNSIWQKELFVAKSLYVRHSSDNVKSVCKASDISKAEDDVSDFCGRKITLDDCQKKAIQTVFDHKVSIITGGGGSGKSTICRCIYEIAKSKGLTVRMMSPTGKASQVLETKTGCEASTIHRGLKMKPGDDIPRETIAEDILLVDEISMCGIDTMYAMMYAIDKNIWAHIVFVGDKNQLPSVSPGNFLSDIMESGCANIVTLDKIHRQSEGSYISLLANQISTGKVVTVPDEADDITWHNLSVATLPDDILKYIDRYLKDGKDINDLQIMSPMKKGPCGVYSLNEVVQNRMAEINSRIHGAVPSIERQFAKFYKGDRVIQLENDYEKMVFNGDMGVIVDLGEKVVDPLISDKQQKFITVDFYGDEVDYYDDQIEQLQLAWCITVHKFQGSQSPNIVFVMSNEAQIMMSKELVYTALTRGEKKVDIFGHDSMLRIAPTKSVIKRRYTNFTRIIDSFKQNKKILQVLGE